MKSIINKLLNLTYKKSFIVFSVLISVFFASNAISNTNLNKIFNNHIENTSPQIRLENNQKKIDVLLLLALPAAGKSEIRNYLSSYSQKDRLDLFNIGEMVQIDDFPYVYMMRRISEELDKMNLDPIFYPSSALPFNDPKDWGSLIYLINEDYSDIIEQNYPSPISAAEWLFDRLDQAREKAGCDPKLSKLSFQNRQKLASILEEEAQNLLQDKLKEISIASQENITVVIEFSRGGAAESTMPLPQPYGYQHSLSLLSPEILNNSSILYTLVSPEESRVKNKNRADPDKPNSILHHYVPFTVMVKDYGCDDIEWLIQNSDQENTIKINTKENTYHISIRVLDNKKDQTTFARKDSWSEKEIKKFQKELNKVLEKLTA
jgi:hypothetical protein